MPELPEVETIVRGLRPVLVGKTLRRITIRQPKLRQPVPEDLGQRLTGATVNAIGRRAKYGLVDTDRGDTLVFHLGMSGRFVLLGDEPPGRHDHVLLATDDAILAFRDPRRFGSLHLLPTNDVMGWPPLAALGPEPLGEDFNATAFGQACSRRKAPVKALLLDQHVVAGIGNIYACEALFAAGIHPARPGNSITSDEIRRLVAAVKQVLTAAIAAGGSTLRDHANVGGAPGYFQTQFDVYGRAGEPCHACGTPIARLVQSGRSTFFCPHCQS